jgi:hypothetical protein
MRSATLMKLVFVVALGLMQLTGSNQLAAAEPAATESCVACWTSPECPTAEQRSLGCHEVCNAWGYGTCLGELSGCIGDDNGWGCFNS